MAWIPRARSIAVTVMGVSTLLMEWTVSSVASRPGEGNIIAYSGTYDGVQVQNGTGNAIRGNAIFSNARRGIELGTGGLVTANDVGDGDGGPNLLQNFPRACRGVLDGPGPEDQRAL